jgi:ubiquinone/menaquinone biosynthesis C-methylase UbiE
MKISEAYDRWAQTYDSDPNLTRDLDAMITRKSLRGLRPRSTMELGCGTGKNTAYLARISDSVLAVDVSQKMIAQARVKVRAGHVVFGLADLSRPWSRDPLQTDLLVCNLVLEHISDLPFIFSEAFRVLRYGGLFFVSELHPSRQYQGKQATFQRNGRKVRIPSSVHNVSDFTESARHAGFALLHLKEWWHKNDQGKPPRLLSMLFQKPLRPNEALQRTRKQGIARR